MLDLVNAERKKAGLSPLKYYAEGQVAADVRAGECAPEFDGTRPPHTRPNGKDCFDVWDELSLGDFMCGENLAWNYPTPEAVVDAWMNSAGHRANILNPDAEAMIVSHRDTYWAQLFVIYI